MSVRMIPLFVAIVAAACGGSGPDDVPATYSLLEVTVDGRLEAGMSGWITLAPGGLMSGSLNGEQWSGTWTATRDSVQVVMGDDVMTGSLDRRGRLVVKSNYERQDVFLTWQRQGRQ